MLVICC